MSPYSDLLSTLPAGPRQRRWALGILLLSLGTFAVLAPFATRQLPRVWAFIPVYETWLICNDAITAVLLFGHYVTFRSRAIHVLACGYVFSALLTIAHGLSFPGLLAPEGWLGAGTQTTAWLYMVWHGGFPLFVGAYSLLRDREDNTERPPWKAGSVLLIAVLLAVLASVLLTTWGHALLPPIMDGNHYTPAMLGVVSTIFVSGLICLLLVARRHRRSLLDLWLAVALSAWLIDIALSAVLNHGRFDLGFYAGRIYGLLATSFVLVMLLWEHSALYARLIQATAALQRMTIEDGLTGLANRRYFDTSLAKEWRRATRAGDPLSLLLIDVDHFKRYNDRHGHVDGDACLRAVAQALSRSCGRAADLAARYGGEEFAVLLPGTDEAAARQFAERLCQHVRELALPHGDSPVATHVTVSVGIATSWPQVLGRGGMKEALDAAYAALVRAADEALYAAKAAGRNRALAITP